MDCRPSLNTCAVVAQPRPPLRRGAGNCRQRRLPNSGDANPGARCVGGNIAAPPWRGSQVRAHPCSPSAGVGTARGPASLSSQRRTRGCVLACRARFPGWSRLVNRGALRPTAWQMNAPMRDFDLANRHLPPSSPSSPPPPPEHPQRPPSSDRDCAW